MPNYKIIGADQTEYGPVSAEQIRQWIAERRVDSETKLQVEGGGEWKRLAEVPESLRDIAGAQARLTCPTAGNPSRMAFDSCWKCGTGRNGLTEVDDRPSGSWGKGGKAGGGPCPECGSSNVTPGRLLPVGRGFSVMFEPEGTHSS